jgi:hypothetical protein
MPDPATLIVWFHLRAPALAPEFEQLMAAEQDTVLGSLDTVSEWHLAQPVNVPGQSAEPADYVLLAEIEEVDRWQQQATEQLLRLLDELAHLVWSPKMLVVRPIL